MQKKSFKCLKALFQAKWSHGLHKKFKKKLLRLQPSDLVTEPWPYWQDFKVTDHLTLIFVAIVDFITF